MLDLLIIGSGGAGLTAALNAKEAGLSVSVVTKTLPTGAQTAMAQGGMNAALGNIEPDNIESHIQDTLKSAHGLADADMVKLLCEQAPDVIAWLNSIGVPFSRVFSPENTNPTSTIAQRRLGGATHSRACYAQDYTGLKILHTLYDQCIKADIEFVTEHYLMNLIKSNNQEVQGATFWDIDSGKVVAITAKKTILATGGYGEIYHNFTTNSYGSTGDGITAILRAGGEVSDMEFIQFHPTALKDSSILISESARGEGGYLINQEGKRFTDELAPRDEVARAIWREVRMGHHISLDIRHLGEEKISNLMPQELHLCRLHAGIDPITEPIPIMPVAHYTMGGIDVDKSFQASGLKHCYAVGECSNAKVHGANRLGGNSLLEIVTFGRKVAQNIIEDIEKSSFSSHEPKQDKEKQIAHDEAIIEKIFAKPNDVNFYHKRKVLGKLLYKDAGILRNRNDIHEAVIYLESIQDKLAIMGVGDKSRENNQNLVEFLEFRNSLLLAEALLKSALHRQESRGAHYREDFPIERVEFEKHTYCKLTDNEKVEVLS